MEVSTLTSCETDAMGCVRCVGDAAPVCPGARCEAEVVPPNGMVEAAMCQRAYTREVEGCFGTFVRLHDGTLCGIQDLFTNLPRSVLSCGPCETVISGP